MVYTYFASLGYEVIPEDTTNKGRVDLTVKTRTGIWIFEFKVVGIDKSGENQSTGQEPVGPVTPGVGRGAGAAALWP